MVRLALKTCRMKGDRGSRGQNLRYSTRTPLNCLSQLGVIHLRIQPVLLAVLLTPEAHSSGIKMQEIGACVESNTARFSGQCSLMKMFQLSPG